MIRKNKTIAKIMALALCANTLQCVNVFGADISNASEKISIVSGESDGKESSDESIMDLEETNNTTTGAAVQINNNETGENKFSFDESTGTITGYKQGSEAGKIVVPEEINGVKVKAIGENAFAYSNISEIVLPEGVEEIGDLAFAGCSNLEKVQLPESLEDIGRQAFYASSIKDIVIPNKVQEIKSEAFSSCLNLQNVEILGDIQMLDMKVFAEDRNLKLINIFGIIGTADADTFSNTNSTFKAYVVDDNVKDTLLHIGLNEDQILSLDESPILTKGDVIYEYPVKEGDFEYFKTSGTIARYTGDIDAEKIVVPDEIDGVKILKIGQLAFNGLKAKEIVLPKQLEEIGESAFLNCSNLEKIEIPESVRYIGRRAFEGSGIKNIVIPKKVKGIEEMTFLSCTNLEKVIINSKLSWIGYDAFGGDYNLKEINLPASLSSICECAFCSSNSTFKAYVGSEAVKGLLLSVGVNEDQIIVE